MPQRDRYFRLSHSKLQANKNSLSTLWSTSQKPDFFKNFTKFAIEIGFLPCKMHTFLE